MCMIAFPFELAHSMDSRAMAHARSNGSVLTTPEVYSLLKRVGRRQGRAVASYPAFHIQSETTWLASVGRAGREKV